MSKKWYTSDFHFNHFNILTYCKDTRPFETLDEMHDAIIYGINSTIAPNDELFILGDVSFDGYTKIQHLLERIKGQKHLIIGNHDAKNLGKWPGWKSVSDYKIVRDSKQEVILMHYPIESWKGMTKGTVHLHGHRHGIPGRYNEHPTNYFREDVGVDPWKFQPVNLDMLTTKWLKEGKIV